MPLYVVRYKHPNLEAWREHLPAHARYLQDLLSAGVLRASGPFNDVPDRAAMLIIQASDRTVLHDIIAKDPFAIEGPDRRHERR